MFVMSLEFACPVNPFNPLINNSQSYLDNEYGKFYALLSTTFIFSFSSLYRHHIFGPLSGSFRPQVQNLLFTLSWHNGILLKNFI
jgi:hypothetical protein